MDENKSNELRARIDALPRTASGRRRYTAAVKKDSVAFVKASMAAGWSQERVATQLGINKATVSFWLGRRRKPTKKKRSEPKLKPVVVASTRRKAGVGGVSVMLAGGHRVEGLDLEQVVALAKALACS